MQGEWKRRPQGATSVVFVHGILSSGETAWRHDNGAYWPELLKNEPELGSVGIYVFTYQTGIFSGSYRLGDIVDALKEHMRLDGALENDRLIFVCHSMGGLVVRKFLVERASDLILADKKVGLFLVASPSLGANYANWLSPLAQLFGQAQVEALLFIRNNAWLSDLDKEFINLKEAGKLKIKGKELVEDKFIVLKKFWRRQVVEPFAGARYFGEPYKVPGSDHFSIAKPKNDKAIQHRLLHEFVKENLRDPVVQQNVTASDRPIIINEIDYVPKKPEDSFLLRYLWLDATTSSFLIAGRFDPGLARLLPANPIVIHNPVFQKLLDVVNRFGHLEGLKTNLSGVLYTLQTTNDLIDIDGKWRDPSDARNKLRIYAAEQDIVWPDEPGLRAIFKTTEWPHDYNMTYEEPWDWRAWQEPEDNVDFQNVAISCVRLHAPISMEMLTNYWASMKMLENAISRKEFKRDDVTNIIFADLTHSRMNTVRNKAIDAMLYFGERGWPEDFLFAFGDASISGCGAGAEYDYRFGFYAKPRKLFTLVAVIEPRQNDLQIERLRYSVDSREQLRKLQEGGEPRDSPPGVVTIKKGEMAVIPLRIELRYDLDEFRGITDADAAKKVQDRIKSLTLSTLKFTGREIDYEGESHPPPPLQTVFSKSVSSFRLPAPLKFTPAYVFGPAFSLNTLTIKGTEIAVRSAPAAAVAYLGKAPVGSCPFLFISNGMDDPSPVGRVLIGASRKDLARTEEIKLPKETCSFFISEQEPEVTFLETVGVKDSSSGIEQLIASNVALHPGDAREFFIPKGFVGEVTLRLRGYYKPLRFDRFVDSGPASTTSPPE
jgi:pimeloyl-ACP methyl ester carboxylesterase